MESNEYSSLPNDSSSRTYKLRIIVIEGAVEL